MNERSRLLNSNLNVDFHSYGKNVRKESVVNFFPDKGALCTGEYLLPDHVIGCGTHRLAREPLLGKPLAAPTVDSICESGSLKRCHQNRRSLYRSVEGCAWPDNVASRYPPLVDGQLWEEDDTKKKGERSPLYFRVSACFPHRLIIGADIAE
ncbi:hypothetical protein CEXT_506671 [Caerostris extrusa]|uniref:Uncharacterized protein n=1 Tax=Caerostris extrusa TaxID=172846 RepID=A0AAV4MVH5_CAEEX|nr:hypothetical protein CEXT_506671 [Caerostris extrusa]